jgi:hypothetical protein
MQMYNTLKIYYDDSNPIPLVYTRNRIKTHKIFKIRSNMIFPPMRKSPSCLHFRFSDKSKIRLFL